MKKVIVSIFALAASVATAAAQSSDKMYLWLNNGRMVEYSIADVDSISFHKYGDQGGTDTPGDQPGTSNPETSAKETMQKLRDDLVTFAPNLPNENYGTITAHKYMSMTAGHQKNVNVLLPANYNPQTKYPVLFVLHGIFGDENAMTDGGMGVQKIIANAVKEGKTKDMIVIFPQMYTCPTADMPSYGFDQQTMRYYDNFINDIVNDLLPWAKREFSIADGRKNTAICGFSMGGRESLYIGTQRSDVFGFVGAACPAPGIVPTRDQFMEHEGSIKNEADFRIKEGNPDPYILLVSGGTNDGTVGNYPEQYHNILTKNGVDHVWHSIPGTGHDGSSVVPSFYNFIGHIFNVAE